VLNRTHIEAPDVRSLGWFGLEGCRRAHGMKRAACSGIRAGGPTCCFIHGYFWLAGFEAGVIGLNSYSPRALKLAAKSAFAGKILLLHALWLVYVGFELAIPTVILLKKHRAARRQREFSGEFMGYWGLVWWLSGGFGGVLEAKKKGMVTVELSANLRSAGLGRLKNSRDERPAIRA
jgi:hypothetical protein